MGSKVLTQKTLIEEYQTLKNEGPTQKGKIPRPPKPKLIIKFIDLSGEIFLVISVMIIRYIDAESSLRHF